MTSYLLSTSNWLKSTGVFTFSSLSGQNKVVLTYVLVLTPEQYFFGILECCACHMQFYKKFGIPQVHFDNYRISGTNDVSVDKLFKSLLHS